MTDWVHLQGRPARFLLNAGPVALLVGILFLLASDDSGVPYPGSREVSYVRLTALCAGVVMLALMVLGPALPLVKVHAAGFTVLGLPWQRVSWDDVTGIRRYSGAYLKYLVVTRRSEREVWLTQPRMLYYRNADLDEELNALMWRWDDSKQRNADA